MTIPRPHFAWQPPSLSPIATLMIVSALLLQGCTTPVTRQPLTETARSNIHVLEIEVTEQLPRITLELPSKGAASGAGRKAGKWAGNLAIASGTVAGGGFLSGNVGGALLGLAIGGGLLVFTPVAAVAGAVKGSFEAASAESVKSSEAQVLGVLQAEDLLHRLREQVLKEVVDKTSIIIAGQLQRGNTRVVQENPIGFGEGREPDSVLRIQLKSLELHGPYEVDPELALHLETEVTLTTAPAGTSVYSSPFRYVTRALRLSEWVENDAKLFTEAVNLSLARLAEFIVDDLFLINYIADESSDERERLTYKN